MKKIIFSLCCAICFSNANAQLNWTKLTNYFTPVVPVDLTLASDASVYCLWQHPQYKSGLLRSTDNGQTWTNLNPSGFSISEFAGDIVFSGNNLLLATSTLWISTDNGQIWIAGGAGLPTNIDLGKMTVLPDGTVFLAASTNDGAQPEPKLFKSTNNGMSFTNVTMSGISTTMEVPVDITNSNGVLVMSLKNNGLTTGQIYFSSDSGATWTSGNSPAAAFQFYDANSFTKDASGALYIIGRELSPSGIKLFKSIDSGVNWTAVSNTGLGNVFPSAFIKTSGPFLVGGGITNGDGEMYASFDAVGISEQEQTKSVVIFPNPSSGKLTISSEHGNEIKNVEVTNLNGEIVYVNSNPGSEIDLTPFSAGIYVVKLQDISTIIRFERIVIIK